MRSPLFARSCCYIMLKGEQQALPHTVALEIGEIEFRFGGSALAKTRCASRRVWLGQRDRCGDQGFRWDDHMVLRGDQQRPLDGDPGVALMYAKVRARGAATKDAGCCREDVAVEDSNLRTGWVVGNFHAIVNPCF